MVDRFDTVIDICNYPLGKKFKSYPNEDMYEWIDSTDHQYITFLETFIKVIRQTVRLAKR